MYTPPLYFCNSYRNEVIVSGVVHKIYFRVSISEEKSECTHYSFLLCVYRIYVVCTGLCVRVRAHVHPFRR